MSNCICNFMDYSVTGEIREIKGGVSFCAMEAEKRNAIPIKAFFSAFGDVSERIKRLKVSDKSRINIMAEMDTYQDKSGKAARNFKVISVDYVSRLLKPEKKKKKETKQNEEDWEDAHPFS